MSMTLQARIGAYLFQNGSMERLTFAQERRLRKVANRQARKARSDAREFRTNATPEVWAEIAERRNAPVLCATCEVTEGPCKTKSGNTTKNHKARLAVAA